MDFMNQFLLGSLFSKWDLKVDMSVSWQGFFIFMLRIRVGGLPCGLARPLIYIYTYIYMISLGREPATEKNRFFLFQI